MASEQEVMNVLAKLVAQQTSGGILGSMPGGSSSTRDETARAKESGKIISDQISKGMAQSVKNLPKFLQQAIDKSGNKLAKELAGGAKKIQDVLRVEDQITAMKQITRGLKDIGGNVYESKQEADEALEELEKIAKAAGLEIEQFGATVKWTGKDFEHTVEINTDALDKNTEAAEAMEKAFISAEEETARLEKITEKTKRGFKALFDILKNSAKIALDEIRISTQLATADQGLITGITALGISQSEYGKILASTRQEQFAMAAAGVDFKENLTENARRLQFLTASNDEAAQVNVLMMKNAARMGVSQDKLGNVIGDQITMYEKSGRAYGQAAIEVARLTDSLMGEDDFRLEMVRMREAERKEFVLGIQQRQKEFKTMGYTDERAKNLQKTFAALAAMNPKERMKQAAKKRAMLGALGLGAEGAELMDLETRYQYVADPKEKAKMQERMAQIQAKASSAFIDRTGAGADRGTAMAFGMMADKMGFDAVVKTFETESGKGLKHQKEAADKLNEIDDKLKGIKTIVDYVSGAASSAVGSVFTGAAGAGGQIMAGMGGGLAAAGVTKMFGGKGMDGGGKGGQSASKAAKKSSGKLLSKAGLKSMSKKIPGLAILAGIGYAVGRLQDGDLLGAAGELASGAAGSIPGLGTAASVAIDASLAARDIAKADDTVPDTGSTTSSPEMKSKSASKKMDKQEELDTQLLATLQELQAYLKITNDQNSEQTKDVKNLSVAIVDATKHLAFRG